MNNRVLVHGAIVASAAAAFVASCSAPPAEDQAEPVTAEDTMAAPADIGDGTDTGYSRGDRDTTWTPNAQPDDEQGELPE